MSSVTNVTNVTLGEIGKVLRERDGFVILSHTRPDGDAIGSQVALGSCLKALGKRVRVVNEDGVPPSLAFLPGVEMVEWAGEVGEVEAEVVVALDTGSKERLGESVLACVPGDVLWIDLDHHVSNPGYGEMNYVDAGKASTGEILYALICEAGLPLTDVARDCLYVAISTDTGSFRYSGTSAETYRVAADLVDAGVEVGRLGVEMYASYPLRRLRLMQELFSTLELSADGAVASWVLKREVIERLELLPSDAEGLVDVIRSIDVVKVALFFEDMEGGKVRLSARSKEGGVDVCALCQSFGGGGHRLAAGARLPGPIEEARERVIGRVGEMLNLKN